VLHRFHEVGHGAVLGGCIVVAVCAARLDGQRIDIHASLHDLEAAAQADSMEATNQFLLASAYWSHHKLDLAEARLRRAIALDPRYTDAYLALAQLPYARRPTLGLEVLDGRVPEAWRPRVEEAARFRRLAFLLDPLADIDTPSSPADTERQPIKDARERFRRLDELVRRRYPDPADTPGDVLFSHGIQATRAGRFPDAIADFTVLLERLENRERDSTTEPFSTDHIRYILAELDRRAGRFDEAVRLYREAAERDAGLFMAHVRQADILEAAGRFEEAVTERGLAVTADPEDPTLLVDLARTLVVAGRPAEAEAPLRQAVAWNPPDPRALYLLGLVTLSLADTVEARAAFVRFIALAPRRLAARVTEARQRLDALR
jgi:tetratricopeptide (TPR) repeat protein